MSWNPHTSNGLEAQKIKYLVVPFTRGFGLDLGCGPKRIWPQTLGVDRVISPQGAALARDITDLKPFANQALDYLFSSHALEDFPAERTQAILEEWWRVIRPGGYLILYLPHEDHYPRVGQPGCNPAHKRNFNPSQTIDILHEVCRQGGSGARIMVNEVRTQGKEYSFLQVFKKLDHETWDTVSPLSGKKRALVIRYGGFGDILQAASVLPQLKAEGYEVWMNTTPKGQEILARDPHVDGWWIQDTDQVPNGELGEYWRALEERFERIINLCESVEGTLLTLTSRISDRWHRQAREMMLNRNYMELVHAIAGVSGPSSLAFYPSPEEFRWASRLRRKVAHGPLVMWVLAGSSVHKAWPYMDYCLAALLQRMPTMRFILVGDAACRILESGWQKEPRVMGRSGRWGIRQTLAMAQQVDVLVGPETGVMNAMGLEEMGKVLFLSHSSVENLSKHWKNTINLRPTEEVPCHPCHRLHYNWDQCYRDEETGAALCAARIEPDRVTAAILYLLGEFHDTQRSDSVNQATHRSGQCTGMGRAHSSGVVVGPDQCRVGADAALVSINPG